MYRYCECNRDNCDDILRKAHEMFKEADCIFDIAEKEFNENLLAKIYEALAIMRRVEELEAKAVSINEEGKALIENSGCDFNSNKNDPRCKAIYSKLIEQFIGEQNAQDEIVKLLNKILEQIKIGACYDARGDEILEEYRDCIHGYNDKPCGCKEDRYYNRKYR